MSNSGSGLSFFDRRQDGEVVLLTVTKDNLTDEENLEQFGQELSFVAESHAPCRMVCDLARVRYLTSSAIGKLISLHRKLTRSNGRIILCSLQPTVQQILAASHLLNYFEVTEDSNHALAKLK